MWLAWDLRIHHDEVVMPIVRHLGVATCEGLSGDGEAARDELANFMSTLDKSATRFEERRQAIRAKTERWSVWRWESACHRMASILRIGESRAAHKTWQKPP